MTLSAPCEAEVALFTYDFDAPQEWTPRLQPFVASDAAQIQAEIAREMAHELSHPFDRLPEPAPAMSATNAALDLIADDFRQAAFRAFHATRLIEPQIILQEGLRALRRREQIDRMQRASFSETPSADLAQRLARIADWNEDVDGIATRMREGDCWLTPSRSLLHDGGLDDMFNRLGGEFIDTISRGFPSPGEDVSEDPGQPTVVVAVIPSAWCAWAPIKAPRRLLMETLASLGHPVKESWAGYWDVQVQHDIPARHIEFVCERSDPRVAAPLVAAPVGIPDAHKG